MLRSYSRRISSQGMAISTGLPSVYQPIAGHTNRHHSPEQIKPHRTVRPLLRTMTPTANSKTTTRAEIRVALGSATWSSRER